MKWVIGCDVGGTSVKYARVYENGHASDMGRRPVTAADKSQEGMLALLLDIARKEREAHDTADEPFAGMGLGVCGVIDQPDGMMRQSPQFPQWQDFPLKALLMEGLGTANVAVENDVNAIALGEKWTGAAAGEGSFVLLAIGTGFGGAVVLDGRLWPGLHGMAGEAGHMNLVPVDGRPCTCGGTGCIEAYVSQVGLITSVRTHEDRDFADLFTPHPASNWPKLMSDLAQAGDQRALDFYGRWGHYLGVHIGSLLNLLDVELVLVGGGVGQSLPLYREQLLTSLHGHCFKAIADRARIVPCTLGDLGGIVGAASLALNARS